MVEEVIIAPVRGLVVLLECMVNIQECQMVSCKRHQLGSYLCGLYKAQRWLSSIPELEDRCYAVQPIEC